MTRYRRYTATTLDGFLADDQDSLEWLFRHLFECDGPGNSMTFMSEVGAQAGDVVVIKPPVLRSTPDL